MRTLEKYIKDVARKIKTLEAMKQKVEQQPSRLDKLEEVIYTLEVTLSSFKIKNIETQERKKPKFIYVPKISEPKLDTSITEGKEDLKMMNDILIFMR